MSSSLREKFGDRVRDLVIDRVPSGSPEVLILRRDQVSADIRSIDAMLVLRRRGVSAMRAKKTIENVIHYGVTAVIAPVVESMEAVNSELLQCGILAKKRIMPPVDVTALREKSGLSQEEFAVQFNLDLATLKGWEQGRRMPDLAAENYLRMIDAEPEAVARAMSPA
jgi:DNA-binding transcriptional regulator YiaG